MEMSVRPSAIVMSSTGTNAYICHADARPSSRSPVDEEGSVPSAVHQCCADMAAESTPFTSSPAHADAREGGGATGTNKQQAVEPCDPGPGGSGRQHCPVEDVLLSQRHVSGQPQADGSDAGAKQTEERFVARGTCLQAGDAHLCKHLPRQAWSWKDHRSSCGPRWVPTTSTAHLSLRQTSQATSR